MRLPTAEGTARFVDAAAQRDTIDIHVLFLQRLVDGIAELRTSRSTNSTAYSYAASRRQLFGVIACNRCARPSAGVRSRKPERRILYVL